MCKWGNTAVLDVPEDVDIRFNAPGREQKTRVVVDSCLADEVKHLWSLGIRTTGYCCGHGKEGISYIGIEDQDGEDINMMVDLGYHPRIHPDPERYDNFIPGTGRT